MMAGDSSEKDLIVSDSAIAVERSSHCGHGTIQSDFFLAEQLQELDAPSVSPYPEQITADFMLAKELHELDSQFRSQHPPSMETDFLLAKELQELDAQATQHLESDYLLAKQLQEEQSPREPQFEHILPQAGDYEVTPSASNCDPQQLQSDYLLAKQLQEEQSPREPQFEHILPQAGDYEVSPVASNCDPQQLQSDYLLAKRLQEEQSPQEPQFEHILHQAGDYEVTPSASNCDPQQLQSDYLLAKRLQEEHNMPVLESTAGEPQVGQTLSSLQQARDYEVALSVDKELNKQLEISADEQLAMQLQAAETEAQSSECIPSVIQRSSGAQSTNVPPPWWTACPKCEPEITRKYHLIDIFPGSDEWAQVTAPFTDARYVVTKMQRIQNQQLWNRLQAEKQLMKQDRPEGVEINELLLYHTSSASKEVICEEGLDQRLSRQGRFGRGIYFSDSPIKCNQYWGQGSPRRMFSCYVLLGDIKEYPKGATDSSLKREPKREKEEPGLPKTYDSVKGNVTGQNEYIVYNTYRVLPAYVMEYCC